MKNMLPTTIFGCMLLIVPSRAMFDWQSHQNENLQKVHRHHRHKAPPFASWQEKAEFQDRWKTPKKPEKEKGEYRGVYYVVALDQSPPPSAKGGAASKHHRSRRDTAAGGGGAAVPRPTVQSLAVVSTISNRFSTTQVTSVVRNSAQKDSETVFTVQIPLKAFISNFTMLIDGSWFVGEVKEKAKAEEEYMKAKERNETAGKVSAVQREKIVPQRDMELFTVSVNVAAESSVQFVLTYLQLLERRLGYYTQIISIRPNQIVEDLTANVFITDTQGIKKLVVAEPGNGISAVDTEISDTSEIEKHVYYEASMKRQRELHPKKGLEGDLIISYDVNHEAKDVGMVCVDGDYFVHYFSPIGFDPLNKNVVFVIDRSGSMTGEKIEQTKSAMMAILDELRPGDRFHFLLFDDRMEYWPERHRMTLVDDLTVKVAKEFLRAELKARGSTNINDALKEACKTLKSIGQWGSNIIVFLTDGQPTSGVTDATQIVNNVVEEAANKVSVFSLGFGKQFELDFELLKRISYRTGVTEGAVRIYPGLDADKQLETFFKMVNTPLLFDFKVSYSLDIVITDSLTQREYGQYFNGSELIVAGKLKSMRTNQALEVIVTGIADGPVTMSKNFDLEKACTQISKGYAQKLYASEMIRYLLRQEVMTDNEDTKSQIRGDALILALDYNLVTPLTSMVITQQTEEHPQYYDEDYHRYLSASVMYAGSRSTILSPSGTLTSFFVLVLSFLILRYTH